MSEWNSKVTGNVFNEVPGETGRLVFRQTSLCRKRCRPLLVMRKNTGLSRFLFLNPRNCYMHTCIKKQEKINPCDEYLCQWTESKTDSALKTNFI